MSAAKPIGDSPMAQATDLKQSLAQALVDEIRLQRVVLMQILAELESWRAPAPGTDVCSHPIEARQDLGSMGQPWIRCRACKQTLTGGPS